MMGECAQHTRDGGIVAHKVVALLDLETGAKTAAQVRVQVVDTCAVRTGTCGLGSFQAEGICRCSNLISYICTADCLSYE